MIPRMSLETLLAAADEVRAGGAARDPWVATLRLVGIGWATVELERAAGELRETFSGAGLPEPAWSPAAPDGLLGASAWVATGLEGQPAIVLLEPATEGRLAATLARFDEGVAAIYLEVGTTGTDAASLGRFSPGPLGTSRLLLARPTWGPHVVVVGRSASDAAT